MNKKVLGLDIGSNSIGYSLLELYEDNNQIIFNDLVSNSIVFSEPNTAKDRRDGRSSRRGNRRKHARKKYARNVFVKYNIASKEFLTNPTSYMNKLNIIHSDVYTLRNDAVNGKFLCKDEFLFCTYSILTDRGYNNMFSISNEDGVINDAVLKNKESYLSEGYTLPSMVLTEERKKLADKYQNIAIRNKKDDYKNSLDREMHKVEFQNLVDAQANNKELFESIEQSKNFINEMLDETIVNSPFYQRPLKSFENMVEYCTFYNKYNTKGSYKRVPLSNIRNIELTLRQKIDNYQILNKVSGEIKSSQEMLSVDEMTKIIEFWLKTPTANIITAKNIFKNSGFVDLQLHIPEKVSQDVFNIQAHRQILEVLNEYSIDFNGEENDFYNKVLLELYYYKNHSSRVKNIEKQVQAYGLNLDSSFIQKIVKLENMDGFASFSLEFINEVLHKMKEEDKTHYEALESLGYYSKYLEMEAYTYLPPLEPTDADIKWLQDNIENFHTKHLFYQPMISPKVKRVVAILRKLINEILKKYGNIDEIRIETAKEMNTKHEKEQIEKNQSRDKSKNLEAKKYLENHNIKESSKNIERAKLWIEQGGKCLYSEEPLTNDEAFNEKVTEIEHFIPRSTIWINSYKNKILVKSKYNQNKSDKNPIVFLKSIGEWENFRGRVKASSMHPRKKDWLRDENIINSVMNKEHWQESYLNDTRSATRSIQKYLSHYLYPVKTIHGKDEIRKIFSVSGKAISELKYMWGIHTVMPRNSYEKKDRNTNYHHTLDAFIVALCSSTAINTLHSHFKKKENKFKTKIMKEKVANELPKTKDGVNVVEYLKQLVEKYEKNQKYVVPYNKRKTNMKGFKDGNKKLYITTNPKDSSEEILAEIEKVAIDTSILVKKTGLIVKDRSDADVHKYVESIQARLDSIKQKKIIDALEVYVNKLLELRAEQKAIEKEINSLDKKRKNGDKYKEHNADIREQIKPFSEKKKALVNAQNDLKCTFVVKNGKQQIVRSLKLHKTKIEKSKADAIIFQNRKTDKIERLNVKKFQKALDEKEPFVIKENEATLYVELFNTKNRGQAVGLNYFSSIANNIESKFNSRYRDEINSETKADLILYKNDIIKVLNTRDNVTNYYVFNGGGNVTGTNNKLSIKNINLKVFLKNNKNKGLIEEINEDNVTPNKNTIISRIKIDFFGNIEED